MMKDLLDTLFPSENIRHAFLTRVVKTSFIKGSILIQAGRINNDLFFLEKGIARGYYYNDNDITSWIVSEGHFVVVPHSFFSRKPSAETVHFLENSVIYSISYEDLEDILQQYPEVSYVKSRFLERYLFHYEERIRALRSTSALNRLIFFEEHYSKLLNRVPQKYIASFLGITPQTLSKLRSDRVRQDR